MKKLSLMALAIIVVSVFFYSCKKTEVNEPTGEAPIEEGHRQLKVKGAESLWRDAANPENPMDEMGLHHNQCLKFITDNLPYDKLTDAKAVYEASFKYGEVTFGADEMRVVSGVFKIDELGSFYETIRQDIPSLDAVMEMTKTTGQSREYLKTLLVGIYDPKITDFEFERAKRDIIEWESGISGLSISDKEKSSLYGFGSTLRYSLLAWSTAEFPEKGDEHVIIEGRFRLRLFGWIATAVFDAVGFIGGSVATPVTGVIVGAAMSAGAAGVSAHNGW